MKMEKSFFSFVIMVIMTIFTMSGCATFFPPPPPPSVATQNIVSWAGRWSVPDWGTVTLSQSGNTVTGTYTTPHGQIVGTISGNILRGTWTQPGHTPDRGTFEFTMSADRNSFEARWKVDGSVSWDGASRGTRL